MSVRLDDGLVGRDLLGDLGVLHALGPGLGNLQLALEKDTLENCPINLSVKY